MNRLDLKMSDKEEKIFNVFSYEAPSIEVIEVMVERGFAGSITGEEQDEENLNP